MCIFPAACGAFVPLVIVHARTSFGPDLEILERRIDRAKKALKGDKSVQKELDFFEALKAHLENGKSARSYDYSEEEREMLKDTPLLSNKPVIYAANLSEADFTGDINKNAQFKAVCAIAAEEHSEVRTPYPLAEQDPFPWRRSFLRRK